VRPPRGNPCGRLAGIRVDSGSSPDTGRAGASSSGTQALWPGLPVGTTRPEEPCGQHPPTPRQESARGAQTAVAAPADLPCPAAVGLPRCDQPGGHGGTAAAPRRDRGLASTQRAADGRRPRPPPSTTPGSLAHNAQRRRVAQRHDSARSLLTTLDQPGASCGMTALPSQRRVALLLLLLDSASGHSVQDSWPLPHYDKMFSKRTGKWVSSLADLRAGRV
jgi:hypothetical protein